MCFVYLTPSNSNYVWYKSKQENILIEISRVSQNLIRIYRFFFIKKILHDFVLMFSCNGFYL